MMMEQPKKADPRRRFLVLATIVLVLFGLLVGQLMNLQVVQGADFADDSENTKTRTLSIKGKRGSITDVNGLPLAYSEDSYDVEFYREPGSSKEKRKEYTAAIRRVIQLVEQNGGTTITGFSIEREGNAYVFNWKTTNEEVAQKRLKQWVDNFYLASINGYSITAQEAYEALITQYGLEDATWEEAYKVLSIWQEWQMNAYLIRPIPIARSVDIETVAQIEARQYELLGISIAQSSTRVYPRGTTAAHAIGYTGSITEDTWAQFKAQSYSATDLVGISGIERSMEEQLTGNVLHRQGSRMVEVDALGRVKRELSYKPASDGNNVMLTLDLEMQQVAEQALANNILTTRNEQLLAMNQASESDRAFYYNTMTARGTDSLNLAQTGAAVVMEVNTGRVLAMVNYPSFDLNDFVGGLSEEKATLYFDTEKSELAKLSPTYNRAVATRATPGSIFKMVTAMAGVQEGAITIDEEISDLGEYTKYTKSGKAPACWIAPSRRSLHANEDLAKAIKDSCNYYFYETSDRLGIEKINRWATALGLTNKTGIELTNESTGIVGNQTVLYDPERDVNRQRAERTNVVANNLISLLTRRGSELGRSYDQERVERAVRALMNLVLEVSNDELPGNIQRILLTEMGLSASEISSRSMINEIYLQLINIRWTGNETILTGIGQSITELTPIAVARYVSAVANGGTVYEAQLVSKILAADGTVILDKQPVVANKIEGAEEVLAAIKEGMHGVIDSEAEGTAAKYFKKYPYTNMIGAKTGTAQVNLIDIENNAWFVAFAPYDEPEIAVVVFIPNGYSGGLSSLTAKDIFSYYFESKENPATDQAPIAGQWIP